MVAEMVCNLAVDLVPEKEVKKAAVKVIISVA